MSAEIHVGDIGTSFICTLNNESGNAINIASASELQLRFKRPTGDLVTKSGTLYSDGTDGKFYYISESGFLNSPNVWWVQGYVEISDNAWYTDTHKFTVHKNLEDNE